MVNSDKILSVGCRVGSALGFALSITGVYCVYRTLTGTYPDNAALSLFVMLLVCMNGALIDLVLAHERRLNKEA